MYGRYGNPFRRAGRGRTHGGKCGGLGKLEGGEVREQLGRGYGFEAGRPEVAFQYPLRIHSFGQGEWQCPADVSRGGERASPANILRSVRPQGLCRKPGGGTPQERQGTDGALHRCVALRKLDGERQRRVGRGPLRLRRPAGPEHGRVAAVAQLPHGLHPSAG